jgi:hypothetical protein
MANPMRKAGLFSADFDEQTLIYDPASNHTHCINPKALKVWKLCDGHHSRNDMVLVLKASADHDAGMRLDDVEDLVDASLGRFTELDMLEAGTLMTRRDVGKAALKALAAGLVLSVLIPNRIAAASDSCGSIMDPVTCTRTAGCTWVVGECVAYEPPSGCETIEDEEACIADPACLWIGICISNDG